jgi:hypothetical protein
MDAFLQLVLPPSGVYYAVSFTPQGKHLHYPHHDVASLSARLRSIDQQGLSAYHACGAFKEECYWEFSQKLQKDVRRYRTHVNARSAKAFWVDLDVDPSNPAKYASRGEAAEDIKRLVALGMPAPTIISSGGGIHLYWPLQEELLAEQWYKFASYLKAVLSGIGIKQDMTRTADIASILRPPTTHNRKNDVARKVAMVSLRGPYAIGDIYAALKKLAKRAVAPIKSPIDTKPQAESILDLSVLDYAGPPANANKIAEHCPQIANFRANRGNISEPSWYAGLGILAYCEDGERFAHDWSSGHADYNVAETEGKLTQWKAAAGPTTCSKFEQEDSSSPSRCAGCKFKGKLVSPIILGREVAAADEVKAPDGNTVVAPIGYFRGADGLYQIVDEAAGIKKKFFSYDIYLTDILTHPHGYEVATFHYQRPHVGQVVFQGKTSLFNKLETAWDFFCNNGVYMDQKSGAETMTQYTRSYLSELHARKAVMQSYTNLGWKEDGSFLLGKYHIGKDFMRENVVVARTLPVAEPIKMAGELAPWVELTRVFEPEDMHVLAFAFLVGLSAPLFHFTGFGGIAVNMVGKTGLGKTSIQRLINSLYGHPEKLLARAGDSPKNNVSRLATMGHLPVCFDELGNLAKERVSNLLLMITQGSDMGRNHNDGTMRKQDTWNTSVVMSSNHPLLAKLSDMKADYDAEAMRMIELTVTMSAFFSDPERGKAFNKTLFQHYGKAGVVFIKNLVTLGETRVREIIAAAEQDVKRAGFEFKAQERFWENAFVLATAAGNIAYDLGLIKFVPEQILRTTYSQINEVRVEMKEEKQTVFDQLAHYVNENFDKLIVVVNVGTTPRLESAPRAGRIEGRITYYQQGEAIVGGELALSCTAIKSWLLKQYADFKEFKEALMAEGAISDDGTTVTLGSGTTFKTPPTRALRINLAHPKLRAMIDRYAVAESNVVPMEGRK